MLNLIGQKFNLLTVIEQAPSRDGKRYWKCKCDCGNECEVATAKLKGGHTKSCGCLKHRSQAMDLTGQKYGRLTALELVKPLNGKTAWKCKCDCGNEVIVRANDLRAGKTQSCGCLQKERAVEGYRKYLEGQTPTPKENLVGQKFNLLTVLEFDLETTLKKRTSENRHIYWKCQCDCGNICSVYTSQLKGGYVKSCGCLVSAGERPIRQLLTSNKIPFVTQKIFNNCILPSGNPARFDFYINNQYLLEYDGEQHFQKASPRGYFTKEKLERIHNSDIFKNQWCKENNIPLIRIPYTHLDILCIEDLMLETSQFKII